MPELEFVESFTMYWISLAFVVFPLLLFVKQPYGRHIRKGWGLTMPNKISWIIMELPSLLLILIIFFYVGRFNFLSVFLISLWVAHYFHRTLIFPFQIKTRGKKMPVLIVLFGFFFNLVNASINGLFISKSTTLLINELDYIRVSAGFLLFITGMFININSDYHLISLRKNSTNGYKIPQKGMFEYVSCPNYFGEIIEWAGFAIIAFNPAALSFIIWTMVNLIPRAIDHHTWYKNTFPVYPQKRKALFPFIL